MLGISIAALIRVIVFFRKDIQQLIYGRGVPNIRTSDAKLDVITAAIDIQPGETFVDLGAGSGAVLCAMARVYPDIALHGYERAPAPFAALQQTIADQPRIIVHNTDFFAADRS